MKTVDLNCDMGESFGPWQMGRDAEIMPLVSSTNIACGFHAGDASTIARTIDLALEHGVAVGAHPGYPDLQGFGRRDLSVSPAEVFDLVQYQIAAIKGMCEARGGRLTHVKPHGALYNRAAEDAVLAAAIARATASIDGSFLLYGLSGSVMISAAREAGLQTVSEVFADRSYQQDGTLTPRSREGALITDAQAAAAQALRMVREGRVAANGGYEIAIEAGTICIHGDGVNALAFARAIRNALEQNNIVVLAPQMEK